MPKINVHSCKKKWIGNDINENQEYSWRLAFDICICLKCRHTVAVYEYNVQTVNIYPILSNIRDNHNINKYATSSL